DLKAIFERFKQVDSSTTREFQGTGLGLALVKELTQEQGGNISVDSVFKEGTTFSLSFDIDDSKDRKMKKAKIGSSNDDLSWINKSYYNSVGVASEFQSGELVEVENMDRDIKILVVDDEPDMLSFITKTLSKNGYGVASVKDGKEAIKVAKKGDFDVILLDLMLPNIDGFEVCKILREDKKLEFVKIILLTAKADENSKIMALKNGVDDFMVKPFSKDELLLRIDNLSKVKKLQTILREDLVISKDELRKSLEDLRDFQQKLIQSEKLNSIGSLSASVIHEVNNLLNYALMAISFLRNNDLVEKNEDLKDIANDIEIGVGRINEIVKEFRNFARIDGSDKQSSFVLYDAINSALKFTMYDFEGIEVINNIDSEIRVIGSASHITQVLINLISNSCKAIKQSGKQNGLIVFKVELCDKRVKVTIKDNGVGVSKEKLGKIFDVFYTTNEVGKGTGLGLNICSRIIKSHGGDLKATSEVGKGSEFSFDLEIG
ncbi:MAG: response regulator, partial [Rickettsiales bacterium]|nr:response regulator [Rickettsiales bacterium]